MNRLELLDIIKPIIASNLYEIIQNEIITDETLLIELGMDSLTFIKIIVAIEERFGIDFNEDELLFEKLNTVGSLVNCVKRHLV